MTAFYDSWFRNPGAATSAREDNLIATCHWLSIGLLPDRCQNISFVGTAAGNFVLNKATSNDHGFEDHMPDFYL